MEYDPEDVAVARSNVGHGVHRVNIQFREDHATIIIDGNSKPLDPELLRRRILEGVGQSGA